MPGTGRAAGSTPHAMITFSCGHELDFAAPWPTDGDEVFCRTCFQYRTVTGKPRPSWRIACRDCSYRAAVGAAEITARVKADQHVRRRPAHTVRVFQGKTLRETIAAPQQATLDDALAEVSDAPPF